MPELSAFDRGRGAWSAQAMVPPVHVTYNPRPCDLCGATPTRTYRDWIACRDHTPARVAGRAEVPTPDPARTVMGLRTRETHDRGRPNHDRYGNATDSPRYRGGTRQPDGD